MIFPSFIKKSVLLISILFLSSSPSKWTMSTNNEFSLLEITFQDFFNKDIISLKINDCTIFNRKEITSNEILGFTDLSIKLIESDKVIIKDKKITLPCSITSTNTFTLKIVLNNQKETIYTINQKKGKYIGLNKIGNELKINQSKEPFEYD